MPPTATTACRSCGAPIVWGRTLAGRALPLNADTDPDGRVVLYSDGTCRVLAPGETGHASHLHVAHFATCPNADQHRRR